MHHGHVPSTKTFASSDSVSASLCALCHNVKSLKPKPSDCVPSCFLLILIPFFVCRRDTLKTTSCLASFLPSCRMSTIVLSIGQCRRLKTDRRSLFELFSFFICRHPPSPPFPPKRWIYLSVCSVTYIFYPTT